MSSTASSFSNLQKTAEKHPSQRSSTMEDKEKIQHLKNEIDNLRSQIKSSEYTSTASLPSDPTAGSNALSAGSTTFPILSLMLLLGLVLVVRWRGRGGAGGRRITPLRSYGRGDEDMTMSFELQDAHDYSVPSITTTTNNNSTPTTGYEAPSAAVQFV